MNEVVKFLQENPVQYLATVGRDGKANAVRLCSALSRTENCGSVQITQRRL